MNIYSHISLEIRETQEFSIFKTFKGNRLVNRNQVESLKRAIQQKNLLRCRPIIVNTEMEIIDGQHRLEAAKELNIPIPYIVNPNADYRDATILNANNDNWDLNEYLRMYLEYGYPQYVKLKNFQDRHALDLDKTLMFMTTKSRSPEFSRTFKEGIFVFSANEVSLDLAILKIKEAVFYIKSKTIIGRTTYLGTKTFWRALYKFITENDIDWSSFMRKLEYKCDSLRPMSQIEDYVRAFRSIYNFNRKGGKLPE
jgi:hypothetical protein